MSSLSYPIPTWQAQVCSLHLRVYFYFVNKFILSYLIPHISDNIQYLFFFLNYFVQCHNLQIYPCGCNGIISFHLLYGLVIFHHGMESSLSMHLLMDIQIVSISFLLYKQCHYKHRGTCSFFEFQFCLVLVLSEFQFCLGMGLLDHVVTSTFSLLIKVKQECGKADLKLSIQKKRKDHGIWVHHFMTHRRGKIGNDNRSIFILGVSKITADHDCSHEIKRYLFLGRKVMTNLDSILKSRDIILLARSIQQKLWFFQQPCIDVRAGP